MKAKSTHLAMLACLTAGAAHANPGAIGGVNSRLENIPDHQFSITTRLKGEVLFGGAFGDQGDSLGDANLFSRSDRLKLGTPLQGWETSLTGAFGYTSNQQENTNNTDESAYYNLGARFLYGGSSGRLSYTTGFEIGAPYYDNKVNREGRDDLIPDINAILAFRYDFSDSVQLDSTCGVYYGGHSDIGRGFTRSALFDENYYLWDSTTRLHHRFDGNSVGSTGFEWTTEATTRSYTTFEQSDVVSNYDGDHWLRWACGIGGEHDINDNLTLGLGCSLVFVDDDSYDDTYTSTSLRLNYDF